MKRNINTAAHRSLITALCCVLFAGMAFGQSKTGTIIGQFLKIEPSARIAAIGNAGAALYGDASGIFYNPASLGRIGGADVEFSYNKWLADITYNYVAATYNAGSIGTFALIGTSLNSGEMDVRTVEQPLGTGERFTVNDIAIGIGYGLMLTDRVSIGIQVNYVSEAIWHSSLATFGINFGVQYQLLDEKFTIGASVANFGGRASYEGRDLYLNYDFDPKKFGDNDQLPAMLRTDGYSLPTIFRAGASYVFDFDTDYQLLVSADAIHPNDNSESIAVGGELTLFNLLALRGGYRNLFLTNAEGGATFGAGIHFIMGGGYDVRFDYAFADHGLLEQAHRITVGIGMK